MGIIVVCNARAYLWLGVMEMNLNNLFPVWRLTAVWNPRGFTMNLIVLQMPALPLQMLFRSTASKTQTGTVTYQGNHSISHITTHTNSASLIKSKREVRSQPAVWGYLLQIRDSSERRISYTQPVANSLQIRSYFSHLFLDERDLESALARVLDVWIPSRRLRTLQPNDLFLPTPNTNTVSTIYLIVLP